MVSLQPSGRKPAQTFTYKTSTFRNDRLVPAEYVLAIEEILEIYIDDAPFSITMRLPGDDINLVTGLCVTEGVIGSLDDLLSLEHCKQRQDNRRIVVRLRNRLQTGRSVACKKSVFVSKSSCGLCGKSSAEEICMDMQRVERSTPVWHRDIFTLKQTFEARQSFFPLTGSTHAAAIFTREGDLLAISEDVGRHNALDKSIGSVLRSERIQDACLVIVSSRLSFEMVQKAVMLGIEVLCLLSVPTGLAVQMAEHLNITLIGFLRENSLTIYTHPERVLGAECPEAGNQRGLATERAMLVGWSRFPLWEGSQGI